MKFINEEINFALLQLLSAQLEGDFFYDNTIRTLYATDASMYREMPLAVAIPKTKQVIAVDSAAYGIDIVCKALLAKGDEAIVFNPAKPYDLL